MPPCLKLCMAQEKLWINENGGTAKSSLTSFGLSLHNVASFQPCQKWQQSTPELSVGQVVMIVDSQLPRALWPIGKVIQVIPSPEGRIRVAEVTVKGHTYRHPTAKLIVLPEMPTEPEAVKQSG